ncbi:MAG: hypothetical protein EGQ04_05185, partial [Ruminococcaceae bacterium]|nr:hypothetical protein [Oscillospiraceae bacterium]
MKKIISSMLTVIILSTMFIVGFPASAKATTLNGKAVSKGQIVTVTYRIKAPKLMEDIQAHVNYSSGLSLKSVSYSSEMKKGSFVENHNLTRQIRFNAVCIMKPMNFKKATNLISMKFKITGKGSMKTSLNLICLDATDGTNYGRTGANSQYRKLNISTVTKRLASSVKLNRNTLALKRNKTYKFKATVSPATTDNKRVKWSVSNRKVLKISNGKVKAVR